MAELAKKAAAGLLAAAHDELTQALQQPHLMLAPLPLPAIAVRVVNMAEDDIDAAALAALIQKDAGLAAQIVKIANSALYVRRNPVTSLQQAISWLGIAEVRKVAVSCALRAQMFAGKQAERALTPVWTESLAVACFAQEIARLRRRGVEQAYLSALLHRGGFAALIRMLVRHELMQPLLADEAALASLAAAHESQLAQYLAKDWGLPDAVAAPLQWWREPGSVAAKELPKVSRQALLEVSLARDLAAQLYRADSMATDTTPPEIVAAASEIADELGLYVDDLQTLWSKRELVSQSLESFA